MSNVDLVGSQFAAEEGEVSAQPDFPSARETRTMAADKLMHRTRKLLAGEGTMWVFEEARLEEEQRRAEVSTSLDHLGVLYHSSR